MTLPPEYSLQQTKLRDRNDLTIEAGADEAEYAFLASFSSAAGLAAIWSIRSFARDAIAPLPTYPRLKSPAGEFGLSRDWSFFTSGFLVAGLSAGILACCVLL